MEENKKDVEMNVSEKKEETKKIREEEVRNVKAFLDDIDSQIETENLIRDNKIEFEVRGQKYRVRMLTQEEKQELNDKRLVEHTKLLREKNPDGSFKYMSEADLIKLYKERGIDIDKFNAKIVKLRNMEKDLLTKLGEALEKRENQPVLDTIRGQIIDIRKQISDLTVEKSSLLDISIEQKVLVFVYSYLTYLVLEKLDGDKWIKAFKSFEEFQKSDGDITGRAIYYATFLSAIIQ